MEASYGRRDTAAMLLQTINGWYQKRKAKMPRHNVFALRKVNLFFLVLVYMRLLIGGIACLYVPNDMNELIESSSHQQKHALR